MNPIDREATGRALKRERGVRTQADVAEAMGASKQYVSRLESGREDFTEVVLHRIRKAFPDFEPIRITVRGGDQHVTQTQGHGADVSATLAQTTKLLETANRTLELALRLVETATNAPKKD